MGYGYAGPTQVYVETGVLTVMHWADFIVIGEDPSWGAARVERHDGAQLGAGLAIYSPSGTIGALRNDSIAPVSVLVITIISTSLGPGHVIEEEPSTTTSVLAD